MDYYICRSSNRRSVLLFCIKIAGRRCSSIGLLPRTVTSPKPSAMDRRKSLITRRPFALLKGGQGPQKLNAVSTGESVGRDLAKIHRGSPLHPLPAFLISKVGRKFAYITGHFVFFLVVCFFWAGRAQVQRGETLLHSYWTGRWFVVAKKFFRAVSVSVLRSSAIAPQRALSPTTAASANRDTCFTRAPDEDKKNLLLCLIYYIFKALRTTPTP